MSDKLVPEIKDIDSLTAAKIVHKACIVAYNMDYDIFLSVFNTYPDDYAKEKWRMLQDDFSRWYCSLSIGNAIKFIEYVQSV